MPQALFDFFVVFSLFTVFLLSKTIKNLKVACIANKPENRKVFELYIDGSKKLASSWEFRILESLEEAEDWLEI